jgi:hypothetical protein
MPLSRLDNFIKNTRGNILYVNPNDLDSTDSIENQGNSLARPFKTIQRALIEASRFSYQKGLENDRFGKTTILLYPGEHVVDNRPGWIPESGSSFRLRNGTVSSDFSQWDLSTNFDLTSVNNALYKLNSIYGGIILPRGTSIVGLDLRKTKIRPKYVPNPENDNIERSALFRVTGGCYLWQFSMFDGDPNGVVYKDYTTNTFVPNFSHHKLTCFEYADGVNDVTISDAFISGSTGEYTRTDLDMYYEKVGLVYGPSSGREIEPDYPSSGLDIQPKIDEYRIVGPTGGDVGISSIRAGDGDTSTTIITVTTSTALSGADVDTAIQVTGITASGYNGQYVISDVVSSTEFKYQVSSAPLNALPTTTGSKVNLAVDTVSSSSPYIFNCSLRSVYGMCGMFADGDKATGFKSMVVAQFTGIGLQKDDNAFVKYDQTSGTYKDSTYAGNANIHSDSLAIYKPTYSNYHIKCNNNAVLQIVSVFAIGYAEHFVAESGGDQSITNSNSNFGAKSLIAHGFRRDAFSRDDVGYITHIIPPKEIVNSTTNIEYTSIDIKTTVGVASTNRLYLYNEKNIDVAPSNVIEGYRIGAKVGDTLQCLIPKAGITTAYSARIIVPDTEFTSNEVTSEKKSVIRGSAGINSISSNTITLLAPHNFLEGESIRFISDTGQLPDGLDNNKVYYAITSGVGTEQIKVAQTLNDALNGEQLSINDKGGITDVVSRVSDKNSGDIGHPIQYDGSQGQWYINVATASTDNNLYSTIVGLGTTTLGAASPRTYITRKPDTRNLGDTVYKVRYVIPAASGITSARPPIDGYIIQESGDTTGNTDAEVASYFSPTTLSLSNQSEQRNFKFLSNATWDGTNAYYQTELPHDLSVGSVVEVLNVTSSENTTGISSSGYNNTFTVAGISSAKSFYGPIASNPGTFTNDTSNRTTSLPTFKRKRYKDTYYVYRSQEVQKYIPGEQDGVYHLLILNSTNAPSAAPFLADRFSQPVKNLYPQTNRDTPASDPKASTSFALARPVGEVVVNNPQYSVTKETINKNLNDVHIGFGITDIQSVTSAGTAHTIYTNVDHGLNRVTTVSIANSGTAYGTGSAATLYNARLVSTSSTVGDYATAMVSVDAIGGITAVKIMSGGSSYEVGQTLGVTGTATTTGYTEGSVTVTNIYDNIGDVVRVSGVSSSAYKDYNQLYRITGITTGLTKEITVSSASTVGGASTTGISNNVDASTFGYLTGSALNVTSLTYDSTSGVATVVTTQNHGLRVDNRVRVTGASNEFYNNDFAVKQNTNLTTFVLNIGVSTTASGAAAGTLYVYRNGVEANYGNITDINENIGGRQVTEYAGITTTLSATISSATTTDISITDIANTDINIGDFLYVDDEVMRVKETVTSNPISVFRGVLGSDAETHLSASVIRRIRINPIEFRRNSILRASGHTFEYLGYGPGNYSTALPERQDRQISKSEELLAQSTKQNGGVVVYTGMNSDGDFYIGNKKVSSATGQEELFDAPIPTVTGEDLGSTGVSVGFDVLTPQEISISRSLRVEGGPDNNIISEFDGPVIFSEKVTSTSNKGIEAASIFLQGDATVSRKYTVGISAPTLAGNPGDIVYNATPQKGGYLGWVYTDTNVWRRFGNVSLSEGSEHLLFDKVGIGTTAIDNGIHENVSFKVGSGSSEFFIDGSGNVGIATTNVQSYKMYINGGVYGTFAGDGSGLTNLDSIWQEDSGSEWVYTRTNADLKVAIGSSTGVYAQAHIAGSAQTSLYVKNLSKFISTATFDSDVSIGGTITATKINITGDSMSQMTVGVTTASIIHVGGGGTVFNATASTGRVGIGTSVPRSTLDVEGLMRIKTSYSHVHTVGSSSNVVGIDLSEANSFIVNITENIDEFTLTNIPSESSSFTIKTLQDSTGGWAVGINTFKTNAGADIDLGWPGGGVLPHVTLGAGRSDVYSFTTFDGGTTLYGAVGGQNFRPYL